MRGLIGQQRLGLLVDSRGHAKPMTAMRLPNSHHDARFAPWIGRVPKLDPSRVRRFCEEGQINPPLIGNP